MATGNPPVGLDAPAGPDGAGKDGSQGGGSGGGSGDGTGDGTGDDQVNAAGEPLPEGAPQPEDTPEQAAARDWLSKLTAELATSPVMALPYGDLDAAATVRHGFPDQLVTAQAASAEVLEARDVSSTPALVPSSGLLPPELLGRLGPATNIALRPAALPESATGPVLTLPSGGRVLVAPPPDALWGPGPAARRTALAVRQRLLADAALHALSDDRARPLVRLLPAAWDPGPEWRSARFFRGLDVPWLAAGGLAQALAAPLPPDAEPVGPRAFAYPDAERDAELPFPAVASSARLAASGRTLSELLTDNDVVDQTLTRQGLLAASLWSRPRPGLAAERAQAADDRVQRWLGRIGVRGPSFVTMRVPGAPSTSRSSTGSTSR